MRKVKLHIHNKSNKTKPKNVGKINSELTQSVSEVTPVELAQLVGKEGHTAVLATMNGARAKKNMIEQQVLMLDFDNDSAGNKTSGIFYQTIEETLEDNFIKENASFIYKTFSYTDDWERFRVVFILDEPLKNNEEVFSAYQYLMDKFPNTDKAPKDSSRIFFGGTEVIEIDYSNQLSVKDLPEVEVQVREVRESTAPAQEVRDNTEYETPTWELIKAGEKKLVAERWNKYGTGKSFTDEVHAYDFFRSLDMKELLGVRGEPFHNILSYEKNPSASIWKPEDTNTYLYTELNNQGKNGNNRSYDIIQIVQRLLDSSYMYAEQYLADTTGIDFDVSDEIVEIYKQADRFKKILLSESFKEQHPEMYKIFGRYDYNIKINAIIDIFKGQLYEYDGEVKCLTWMTTKNIAKRLGSSETSTKRLLNLITLTSVVDKLDDDQIPEQLLEIIEKNQEYVRDNNGNWIERKNARKYRSNVYRLGELMANFTQVEERCVILTENNFTMKGMSREYILRTFGKEEADRVYPQDKERTVSKASEDATNFIHQVVMEEIKKNGVVVINEVMDLMQRAGASKSYSDYKYKQQEAEMIEGYGLKKISLTNQLKEEYGITHLKPNARPKVLVLDN